MRVPDTITFSDYKVKEFSLEDPDAMVELGSLKVSPKVEISSEQFIPGTDLLSKEGDTLHIPSRVVLGYYIKRFAGV